MALQKHIELLPKKPGVYILRDFKGQPLYVGKAINLKDRVKSYFTKGLELGPKTAAMVAKIAKIEHIVVESEIEALLLEIDLIKRLKPKYNIQWRDDKMYKYIKISNFKFLISNDKEPRSYSKVATSRTTDDKSAKYFGPFPEGKTVREVLRTLRRVFPFRDCSEPKFKRYQKLGRACLYGDLKLCPAPCVGQISQKDYQKIVRQLKSFLSGKSRSVIQELGKEMKSYSKSKEFEKAAIVRDRIRNYKYVTQSFRQAMEYLEHPNLLEDQRRKELEELRSVCSSELQFALPLERIEAFDVSNISGKYATGSMVVFIDGEPSKKDYRRFKIQTVRKADDVGMIKEVVRRRFGKTQISKPRPPCFARRSGQVKCQKALRSLPSGGHISNLKTKTTWDRSFDQVPNLILVDGGKPQVGAVNEVLEEVGLRIPVLGLVKKEERILNFEPCLPAGRFCTLNLPKGSPALHLLQRIRDEAHRFAVSYHRKLRARSMTER